MQMSRFLFFPHDALRTVSNTAWVAASISHFVTAATKFLLVFQQKYVFFVFYFFALNLCRPFSR